MRYFEAEEGKKSLGLCTHVLRIILRYCLCRATWTDSLTARVKHGHTDTFSIEQILDRISHLQSETAKILAKKATEVRT
jgi:hypothetical protein